MDNGQWTMDDGRWTVIPPSALNPPVASKLVVACERWGWTVDRGPWTVELVVAKSHLHLAGGAAPRLDTRAALSTRSCALRDTVKLVET
jgi:hypothetical protein